MFSPYIGHLLALPHILWIHFYSSHCYDSQVHKGETEGTSPQLHHTLFFCCLPQGFSYIVLLHKTPMGALYVFRHAQLQHPMTQPLMNGDWKSKDKCFPSFLWANNFEAHYI